MARQQGVMETFFAIDARALRNLQQEGNGTRSSGRGKGGRENRGSKMEMQRRTRGPPRKSTGSSFWLRLCRCGGGQRLPGGGAMGKWVRCWACGMSRGRAVPPRQEGSPTKPATQKALKSLSEALPAEVTGCNAPVTNKKWETFHSDGQRNFHVRNLF